MALVDVIPFCTAHVLSQSDSSGEKQAKVSQLVMALVMALEFETEENVTDLVIGSLTWLTIDKTARGVILEPESVATILRIWPLASEALQLNILELLVKMAEPDAQDYPLEIGSAEVDLLVLLATRPNIKAKRGVAKLLCLLTISPQCRMQITSKGGLKTLLQLRSLRDRETRKYALQGIFQILDSEEVLEAYTLDPNGELSQLVYTLARHGSNARVRELAGAVLIKMAVQ